MIKINRPKTPDIKIYTEKKESLKEEVRLNLLKLITDQSPKFKAFIPRLKKIDELYTKAEKETLVAINYYADPNNFEGNVKKTDKTAPTFKAYKDNELKEELRSLFNDKCAYCDSTFLETSSADIEHFRPKKAINPFRNKKDEKLVEPGYYWLAADWNNLLLSCSLCNRRTNLDDANEVGLKPRGKKNRFPLTHEAIRIRSHNEDLDNEKNQLLIIDPCNDDPSEHFEFIISGDVDFGMVKAKVLQNGQVCPKADFSLPIYGLNRKKLVDARAKTASLLKGSFMALLDSIELFNIKQKTGLDSRNVELSIKLHRKNFVMELDPTSSYQSMKNLLIEDFRTFPKLVKMGLTLEDLLEE